MGTKQCPGSLGLQAPDLCTWLAQHCPAPQCWRESLRTPLLKTPLSYLIPVPLSLPLARPLSPAQPQGSLQQQTVDRPFGPIFCDPFPSLLSIPEQMPPRGQPPCQAQTVGTKSSDLP